MPIFEYRSINILRAFILYSLVGAIIYTIAIEVRLLLQDTRSQLYKTLSPLTKEKGINKFHQLIASFIITFIVTITIYHIMYFLIGWGGGMIVSKKSN